MSDTAATIADAMAGLAAENYVQSLLIAQTCQDRARERLTAARIAQDRRACDQAAQDLRNAQDLTLALHADRARDLAAQALQAAHAVAKAVTHGR